MSFRKKRKFHWTANYMFPGAVDRYHASKRRKYAGPIVTGAQQELKAIQANFLIADLIIATTHVYHIGGIALGTDMDDRIGRTTVMKALYINMGFLAHAVPANSIANINKFQVIWDRQPNGVLATELAINQTTGVNSFKNLDNRDRFLTIYDSGPLSVASFSNGNGGWVQQISVRCNLKSVYSGATGGIADHTSGALLFLVTTDSVAAGGGHTVDLNWRIRYTDAGQSKERVGRVTSKSRSNPASGRGRT